jgi:hypothetical protein
MLRRMGISLVYSGPVEVAEQGRATDVARAPATRFTRVEMGYAARKDHTKIQLRA